MTNVLVVAEIADGQLKKTTLTSITFAKDAAQRSGGQVHGLVIGKGIDAAAKDLARYVQVVHAADKPDLEHSIAETYAAVIAAASKAAGASIVCMAATAHGKD